jgi:hypothetical protein
MHSCQWFDANHKITSQGDTRDSQGFWNKLKQKLEEFSNAG